VARILYFSRGYTTHDRRFLEKIVSARFQAFFLRLREDVRLESRPMPRGVKTVHWPGPAPRSENTRDLASALPGFERVLQLVRPNLIHAGPVPTCGYLSALSGFHPLVTMSWGSDLLADAGRSPAVRARAVHALRRSDACVCDSDAGRRRIQQLGGVPARRIVQFPWGVDVREFRPRTGVSRLRERFGWRNAFVVLSLRSWERIYGIDVLLAAFRAFYKSYPSARLLLLGDGSMSPFVKKYIRRHRLRGAVRCPGRVPEDRLPEWFQASDLYMSCSHSDGTSVSLLQALAAGLPALVTDLPSNREWIQVGRNGWLGRRGKSGSFTAGLRSGIRMSRAQREIMAERNRRLALDRADWDQNASRLIRTYRTLLRKD
jgi:L-malate glycosyltransferase